VAQRVGEGSHEEPEDRLGEVIADAAGDQHRHHGTDETLPQLNQMIEQRRLGLLFLLLARHGAARSLSPVGAGSGATVSPSGGDALSAGGGGAAGSDGGSGTATPRSAAASSGI